MSTGEFGYDWETSRGFQMTGERLEGEMLTSKNQNSRHPVA